MDVFFFTTTLILAAGCVQKLVPSISFYTSLLVASNVTAIVVVFFPWTPLLDELGLDFVSFFFVLLRAGSCGLYHICYNLTIATFYALTNSKEYVLFVEFCSENGSFKTSLVPVMLVTCYIFMLIIFLRFFVKLLCDTSSRVGYYLRIGVVGGLLLLLVPYVSNMFDLFQSLVKILCLAPYIMVSSINLGVKSVVAFIVGIINGEDVLCLSKFLFNMCWDVVFKLSPMICAIVLVCYTIRFFKKPGDTTTPPEKTPMKDPFKKTASQDCAKSLCEIFGLLPRVRHLEMDRKTYYREKLQSIRDEMEKECPTVKLL